MSYLLGIDLGSSSVKVSLLEAESGQCVASAHYPEREAPIKAIQPGWAEQRPIDWWQYFKTALQKATSTPNSQRTLNPQLSTPNSQLTLNSKLSTLNLITAIGISYQMHGLVCLDKDLQPLRDAIIWCDSRGVPYGEHAPLPGNFTAAKLAWVKEHEPALFDKIRYIMLPGDYLALRLTGLPATTACGLSEMMLWDWASPPAPLQKERGGFSVEMLDYFGFSQNIIPPLVPTFGEQGCVSEEAAKELGLKAGIPVTYRAGDQPNNALSLRVLHPGEIASTAGTSGVVFGIVESGEWKVESCLDESSSLSTLNPQLTLNSQLINPFLHVNHHLGLMHCVNGCGILNSWLKHNVTPDLSYEEMNELAATVPVGSEGVSIFPFGNGAERVLGNKDIGASIHGLNFNRHSRAHLLRAAQEGVAFAFMYGMELMGEIKEIHAGKANLFLSPLFRDTLASVSGATIRLYDTDGSVGAARGAGIGAGVYANEDEAFASLKQLATIEPRMDYVASVKEAYQQWKHLLQQQLNNSTILNSTI